MKRRIIAITLAALAAIGIGTAVAVATNDSQQNHSVPESPTGHYPKIHLPGPFAGHGDKRLGTITIPAAGAEIYWHGRIALTNAPADAHKLRVGTTASGQRFVSPGTYHNVTVHANGDWTIRIGKRLILR